MALGLEKKHFAGEYERSLYFTSNACRLRSACKNPGARGLLRACSALAATVVSGDLMEAEHRALHRDCSLHTVVADGSMARAVGRQGLLIASECLTPQGG